MRFLQALMCAVVLAACGASGGSQIGTTYTDPEGAYEIQVDPAWTLQAGAFAQGVESWFLGPAEGDFTPNLNVLTQVAPGMDLAQYVQVSIDNAPKFIPDATILARSTFDGPGGQLAEFEYTGTVQGRFLHFLAYFSVKDGKAIVATLTTGPDSFATWRAVVEPFMRTLRPK